MRLNEKVFLRAKLYVQRKKGEHSFQIGYFSQLSKAAGAIERLKTKSGFKDNKGAFELHKFAVVFDDTIVNKANCTLYEVSHEYLCDDGYDCFTIFGVYSTYDKAESVKKENLNRLPYSNYPDGFLISECKVNIVGWSEGFVSYR